LNQYRLNGFDFGNISTFEARFENAAFVCMNFIQRFFLRFHKSKIIQPDVLFGRFSAFQKTDEQESAWSNALKKFDVGEHLVALKLLFEYLKNQVQDNITWTENADNSLNFELIQGSKKILGFANADLVRVEARIVRAEVENLGYLRRLVEHNRLLRHSKYALDSENRIVLLFKSAAKDASPLKILAGLKELATQADKQDDILIDEFPMLAAIDEGVILPISEAQRNTKIEFLRNEITETFVQMDAAALRPEHNAGAQAYLLLNLIYRLDFLVRPEGFTMELLERVHRVYFENDDKNRTQKILAARKELQKILDRSDADLHRELYRTTATFGITRVVEHEKIVHFINGELPALSWLLESKQPDLALAVPGYVAGYSLFNYAMPAPDRALFLLFFQITSPDYFKKLGFQLPYWKNGKLDPKAIRTAILVICDDHRQDFPAANPDVKSLRFDSAAQFARTFLELVRDLNLTPA
jgi:hypothetical protein